MPETQSHNLEAAYHLIDAITRIKGVVGAVLVDPNGEVIAQDFTSQDYASRCIASVGSLTVPLTNASRDLKFGLVGDFVMQMSALTIRLVRQDRVWLALFLGENANIGMISVELKEKNELLRSVAGTTILEERDAQKQQVLDILQETGSVEQLIADRAGDISLLRGLHGLMFQIAIDVGVRREVISRRINDINYRLYRDSLLDIGFDFFNRKALDNYDPSLARKVMQEQITGLASMITEAIKQN